MCMTVHASKKRFKDFVPLPSYDTAATERTVGKVKGQKAITRVFSFISLYYFTPVRLGAAPKSIGFAWNAILPLPSRWDEAPWEGRPESHHWESYRPLG